ncbi:hypothetical protein HYQ46_011222 [Verticillium longisporum]|nr:hypothetical protein HYQ46_011222 [Verticillium longisporum]
MTREGSLTVGQAAEPGRRREPGRMGRRSRRRVARVKVAKLKAAVAGVRVVHMGRAVEPVAGQGSHVAVGAQTQSTRGWLESRRHAVRGRRNDGLVWDSSRSRSRGNSSSSSRRRGRV